MGGQRRQRGQRRYDGYRDHYLQPAVLGADPLVKGRHRRGEDIVYLGPALVAPARRGVRRLGGLLEQYGTYR